MVLTIDPARARLAQRIRLVVLALVALVATHTAVYAVQAGSGERFAASMASSGHDGWWGPACALIVAAALALALQGIGVLARLESAARTLRPAPGPAAPPPTPPIGREIGTIWRRLLPTVVVLFAVQENLEGLASHGRLPGIDVVLGPATALVVPSLVLVTLAVAVAGALVRWRIAILVERVRRAAAASVWRRPGAERAIRRWRVVGALAPRRWMVDRLDAGRAPPLAARP